MNHAILVNPLSWPSYWPEVVVNRAVLVKPLCWPSLLVRSRSKPRYLYIGESHSVGHPNGQEPYEDPHCMGESTQLAILLVRSPMKNRTLL